VRLSFWDAYAREREFYEFFARIAPAFMLQTAAAQLFDGRALRFDAGQMTLTGVTRLSPPRLRDVQDIITTTVPENQRAARWAQVVRLVDSVMGVGGLSETDAALLDSAIRASGARVGLMDVAKDVAVLMPIEIDASQNGWRILGPDYRRQADLLGVFRGARKNGRGAEIIINDVMTYVLQSCCRDIGRIDNLLLRAGFTAQDITAAVNRSTNPMARIGYNAIIYADKIEPAEEKGQGPSRYVIIAYYKADRLDWAQGYIERLPAP
jgi:hypothetical protein